MADDGFVPHDDVGGFWTNTSTVESLERHRLDDLVGQHAVAGIELRITPSIWPWWRRVTESTLEFSGSRLANASNHPDRFGP